MEEATKKRKRWGELGKGNGGMWEGGRLSPEVRKREVKGSKERGS